MQQPEVPLEEQIFSMRKWPISGGFLGEIHHFFIGNWQVSVFLGLSNNELGFKRECNGDFNLEMAIEWPRILANYKWGD